jgi:hypothetical protein
MLDTTPNPINRGAVCPDISIQRINSVMARPMLLATSHWLLCDPNPYIKRGHRT